MTKKSFIAILLITIGILFNSHNSLSAQSKAPFQYKAETFPFITNLPSQEVTFLHQDREGYVWIGTLGGLGRYDGMSLITFQSNVNNPSLLPDNYITPITDTPHFVWIGTKKGLAAYDKSTWSLHAVTQQEFSGKEIKFIFNTGDENLWIATPQALYHCNEQLDILGRYDLKASISSLYYDSRHRLWALTWGHGLYRFNPAQNRFENQPRIGRENNPFVMLEDSHKRLWIGTWGDGMYSFNPQSKENTPYTLAESTQGEICFDIEQEPGTDNLWILTYSALKIFSPHNGLCSNTSHFDSKRMYSIMLRDKDNNLWLGAFDAGYRLMNKSTYLHPHPVAFIKRDLGYDANIKSIFAHQDGWLWMNQERGGITLYSPQQNLGISHPYTQVQDIEVNYFTAHPSGHGVWASSMYIPTIFLTERVDKTIHFTDTINLAKDGSETGHILGMTTDKQHHLWVICEHGLYVIDSNNHIIGKKTAHSIAPRTICTDPSQGVWITTADKHLLQLAIDPASHSLLTLHDMPLHDMGNKNNAITHLAIDQNQHMWLSTSLGTMWQSTNSIQNISNDKALDFENITSQCLPENKPLINLIAHKNNVWLVAANMIVRYDVSTQKPHIVKHITPLTSIRGNASCIGKGDSLFVGGHGGVLAISPLYMSPFEHRSWTLTNVFINDESIFSALNKSNTQQPACRVEGHDITFHQVPQKLTLCFSTLTQTTTLQPTLFYSLDNGPTQQLQPNKNNIVFTHLKRGTHTLKVWGDEGLNAATYTLILPAPWYATTWAYIVYFLLCIIIVTAWWRLTKRSKQEKSEASEITQVPEISEADKQWLEKVKQIIELHLANPDLRLDTLVDALGTSKPVLNRRVKNLTNSTPMDIVKHMRIEKACTLLKHKKELNISDVAYAVGFNDPKYFAKCFKEITGATPSSFQDTGNGHNTDEMGKD